MYHCSNAPFSNLALDGVSNGHFNHFIECSYAEVGRRSIPDDHTLVYVNVDKMGASAAVGFPVGFGVFVCQLVSSMVIGGDLHLLPAFVLLQFHAGAWRSYFI